MTPPSADKALVVIPCLNEIKHLPGLLEGLLKGDPAWHVVVADGGSTDGSAEFVAELAERHPNLTLLPNPRRIQSAGSNLAVRRFGAGRRWLVRIDAHCGYPEGYVEGLIAAVQRTGATSVVVPMVTRGEACFQRAAAAAQNSVLGAGGSAHRKIGQAQFVDHGHHALFDLAAYGLAGGYDESFSHNEDAELDLRLVEAGAKIWLEPSLAIVYYPRRSPAALFRQYIKYGEGRARTIQRHRQRMKVRQIAPLFVAPAAALLIFSPAFWPLAIPAAVWALACLVMGAVLALRARSACVLMSGLAAMTMHLAWSIGFWRQMLGAARPGASPKALEVATSEKN